MSDQDIDKALERLVQRMKNGEQSSSDSALQERVFELRHKLESVKEDFQKQTRRIDDHQNAMFDPDDGIYARVNRQRADIEDLKTKSQAIKKIEDRLNANETVLKRLKSVGGEDLADLSKVVQSNKNQSKIFWVIVTTSGSLVAKLIFDILKL